MHKASSFYTVIGGGIGGSTLPAEPAVRYEVPDEDVQESPKFDVTAIKAKTDIGRYGAGTSISQALGSEKCTISEGFDQPAEYNIFANPSITTSSVTCCTACSSNNGKPSPFGKILNGF